MNGQQLAHLGSFGESPKLLNANGYGTYGAYEYNGPQQ